MNFLQFKTQNNFFYIFQILWLGYPLLRFNEVIFSLFGKYVRVVRGGIIDPVFESIGRTFNGVNIKIFSVDNNKNVNSRNIKNDPYCPAILNV